MDPEQVVALEVLHRHAEAVNKVIQGKQMLLVGHSGYYEQIFGEAIALIARRAAALDRLITHVIRGWMSPLIESRPLGERLRPADGVRPAIVSVLRGEEPGDPLEHRIKLMILTDAYMRVAKRDA